MRSEVKNRDCAEFLKNLMVNINLTLSFTFQFNSRSVLKTKLVMDIQDRHALA